jgi:hypothetical protein
MVNHQRLHLSLDDGAALRNKSQPAFEMDDW